MQNGETTATPTSPVLFETIGKGAQDVDDIADDSEESQKLVEEIESMCINCEENGTTRLLLTKIPFFREVIIMSFSCPHCGFSNTEIQSAGQIQPRGAKYVFKVTSEEDLNRRIIKSDSCTISFPDLDFEIPAQRGALSTIEGILTTALDELSMLQPQRLTADPDTYEKIDTFIRRGREFTVGKILPFTVILDDPAGNSWVDRVPEDSADKWRQLEYQRTPEQNAALGLSNPDAEQQMQQSQEVEEEDELIGPDDVHTFMGPCPSCTRPCATHMMPIEIPHFKEVIIMSTVCEFCGYKSNEVKTGGEVSPMGRKITLKVEDGDDLTRDILKSETCSLHIPELHFDLQQGTLGGRFTTLEGLLQQAYEQLWGRVYNPDSDSSTPEEKDRFGKFLEQMKDAIDGKMPFTLILDDPLSASYIQNLYAPDPDPNMTIEEYERTAEQNEDLGITELIAARAA